MVMISGNKFLVRTSVSVLAMVLSASMALADDQTTAGTDGDVAMTEPEVIVCEMYPGVEAVVEEPKSDDTEGPDLTTTVEDGGTEGPLFAVDPVAGENGEEILVYHMTGGPAVDPEMVRRDVMLSKPAVARESVAHDPASVPNLCDIAGPGLDWLCAQ